MKPCLLLHLTLLTLCINPVWADSFAWKDAKGTHLDLTYGTRSIARYVYEPIDTSSPERRDLTYKPFCHINQWWKKEEFLTKGPGGNYSHHRGIFYGFSKISYTDKTGKPHKKVDVWHCRKAAQEHQHFTSLSATEDRAAFTSNINWIGNDGTVFATEARTMRFSWQEKDLVVDFESTLTPVFSSLILDGDIHHAGFQFRAHQSVYDDTAKATYFIRPQTGDGLPGQTINWEPNTLTTRTENLPWKGMVYQLGTSNYSIAYLDSPTNPKPARFSERDYGRFGSYFSTEVTKEEPLTVRYRLIIRNGVMTADEIEAYSAAFEKP